MGSTARPRAATPASSPAKADRDSVSGPMLATERKNNPSMDPSERRVRLFKEPSPRSAVVTRLPSETQVNLVGCKGDWARVRHQKSEGWLAPDSQCHSTLTTCS